MGFPLRIDGKYFEQKTRQTSILNILAKILGEYRVCLLEERSTYRSHTLSFASGCLERHVLLGDHPRRRLRRASPLIVGAECRVTTARSDQHNDFDLLLLLREADLEAHDSARDRSDERERRLEEPRRALRPLSSLTVITTRTITMCLHGLLLAGDR